MRSGSADRPLARLSPGRGLPVAAVPKADLDLFLALAVRFYFLSVPFFTGYVFLTEAWKSDDATNGSGT